MKALVAFTLAILLASVVSADAAGCRCIVVRGKWKCICVAAKTFERDPAATDTIELTPATPEERWRKMISDLAAQGDAGDAAEVSKEWDRLKRCTGARC